MLKQTAVRGKERDLGKGMTGVLYERYAINKDIEGYIPKEKRKKKKKRKKTQYIFTNKRQ